MPVRLQAIITDEDRKKEVFSELMSYICSDRQTSLAFAAEDGQYFHVSYDLYDRITNSAFGSLVFTLKTEKEEKAIMIEDLDIVLKREDPVTLNFLDLRDGSSDANEYYRVATKDGYYFEVETVNRHAVEGNILDTTREVMVSAFPFELSVYDDIEELNKALGFAKPIKVKGTDLEVHGYSVKFTMPGGILESSEDSEHYSFMIGKVLSFQEVEWEIGEHIIPFIIAQVETAAGVTPTAMSREYFDLEKLKEGAMIGMNADLKALLVWEK